MTSPYSKKLSDQGITQFRKTILDHYQRYGRKLPWRETRDPYKILVSEIMLQQTTVERVVKPYQRFIARFPSFSSLVTASLHDVLREWQGLGYNRRALALKKIAEIVITQYGGILPDSPKVLERLPGIGHYTAAAICTFAFNQATILLETNIRTVFIHFFFGGTEEIRDNEITPLIVKTLDQANPRNWYNALMDYGWMLKRRYPNPSRKSFHYQKQTPFEGSDRKIRGLILKTLLQNSKSGKSLSLQFQIDITRMNNILHQLEKEGLIQRKGHTYSI